MDWIFIVVPLILLCSTFVRTAFGFGDSLLAMPLLAMIIGVKTAAPVMAFISTIVSIVIIVSNRRTLRFGNLGKLVIPTIIGIPLGLIYLQGVSESVVKAVLAVLIILFCLYNIFKPALVRLDDDRYSYLFGFASGLLGGAYNTNGPPIIIYGSLRRWESADFRTLLQGVFLPSNIVIVLGHGIAGMWTQQVINLFLVSLPFAAVSIFLGNKLGNSISSDKFLKYVHYFLLALGVALLIQSV